MTTEALADEDRLNPADLRNALAHPLARRAARGLPPAAARRRRGVLPRPARARGPREPDARAAARTSAAPGCGCSPPDDAADLVQHVPEAERDELLGAARRPDAPRGDGAARLRAGRRGRADEPALRAAAARDDRRRGDRLPAPAGAHEPRAASTTCTCSTTSSSLLGVVSFRELFAAAARDARCATSCARDVVTRARRPGPGGGQPKVLAEHDLIALPGRRRRGPHEGHRHRRRHRRRRAGRGHRGHPEARRHGGPRRARTSRSPSRACSGAAPAGSRRCSSARC